MACCRVRRVYEGGNALEVGATRVVGDIAIAIRLADPIDDPSAIDDGPTVSKFRPRHVHRSVANGADTAVLRDFLHFRRDLL